MDNTQKLIDAACKNAWDWLDNEDTEFESLEEAIKHGATKALEGKVIIDARPTAKMIDILYDVIFSDFLHFESVDERSEIEARREYVASVAAKMLSTIEGES